MPSKQSRKRNKVGGATGRSSTLYRQMGQKTNQRSRVFGSKKRGDINRLKVPRHAKNKAMINSAAVAMKVNRRSIRVEDKAPKAATKFKVSDSEKKFDEEIKKSYLMSRLELEKAEPALKEEIRKSNVEWAREALEDNIWIFDSEQGGGANGDGDDKPWYERVKQSIENAGGIVAETLYSAADLAHAYAPVVKRMCMDKAILAYRFLWKCQTWESMISMGVLAYIIFIEADLAGYISRFMTKICIYIGIYEESYYDLFINLAERSWNNSVILAGIMASLYSGDLKTGLAAASEVLSYNIQQNQITGSYKIGLATVASGILANSLAEGQWADMYDCISGVNPVVSRSIPEFDKQKFITMFKILNNTEQTHAVQALNNIITTERIITNPAKTLNYLSLKAQTDSEFNNLFLTELEKLVNKDLVVGDAASVDDASLNVLLKHFIDKEGNNLDELYNTFKKMMDRLTTKLPEPEMPPDSTASDSDSASVGSASVDSDSDSDESNSDSDQVLGPPKKKSKKDEDPHAPGAPNQSSKSAATNKEEESINESSNTSAGTQGGARKRRKTRKHRKRKTKKAKRTRKHKKSLKKKKRKTKKR
jgi:hypothetical protein